MCPRFAQHIETLVVRKSVFTATVRKLAEASPPLSANRFRTKLREGDGDGGGGGEKSGARRICISRVALPHRRPTSAPPPPPPPAPDPRPFAPWSTRAPKLLAPAVHLVALRKPSLLSNLGSHAWNLEGLLSHSVAVTNSPAPIRPETRERERERE
jgi:hypothetical protein